MTFKRKGFEIEDLDKNGEYTLNEYWNDMPPFRFKFKNFSAMINFMMKRKANEEN